MGSHFCSPCKAKQLPSNYYVSNEYGGLSVRMGPPPRKGSLSFLAIYHSHKLSLSASVPVLPSGVATHMHAHSIKRITSNRFSISKLCTIGRETLSRAHQNFTFLRSVWLPILRLSLTRSCFSRFRRPTAYPSSSSSARGCAMAMTCTLSPRRLLLYSTIVYVRTTHDRM